MHHARLRAAPLREPPTQLARRLHPPCRFGTGDRPMRSIILVAIREYRQVASTRGFWVMLLVLPVVIALTQVAGRFFRADLNSAYVLVDQSGDYEAAIDRRIRLNYQRAELGAFSAYVQRWDLGGIKPDAIWAN